MIKKSTLIFLIVIALTGCGKYSKQFNLDANKPVNENMVLPESLENPNIKVLTWDLNEAQNNSETISEFEKKYGGKVHYTTIANWWEAETKLITSMAAGETFDVIPWGIERMPAYAIKGLIQPIDEYFDLNDPIFSGVKYTNDSMRYKNKLYGVTARIDPEVIFYNKTMFQKKGIKTPLEYFEESNWNWDIMRKIGISLTADTNKDGVVDQWGFQSWDSSVFLMANNADFIEMNEDGTVKLTLDDPKLRTALQMYQDSLFVDKWATVYKEGDFESGKLAMAMNRIFPTKDIPWKGMVDEWDFVPVPDGPSNRGMVTPGTCNFFSIGKGAKNPNGGAVFIYMTMNNQVKNRSENLAKYLTKSQINRFDYLVPKVRFSKSTGMRLDVGSLFKDVAAGNPVSTTLAKYKIQFQTKIDELFSGYTVN